MIWVNAGGSGGSGAGCQFAPLRATASTTNNTAYTPSDGQGESQVKLVLNGHDRMAYRDAKYFRDVQVYQHHTHVPAPTRKLIGGASSITPIDDDASGTGLIQVRRMSRITRADLHITKRSGQADQEYTLNTGTFGDPDATAISGETSAIASAKGTITFTEAAAGQQMVNLIVIIQQSLVQTILLALKCLLVQPVMLLDFYQLK